MTNIPSFCGIISKHMYPLVLLKIAPFVWKLLQIFWQRTPRTPFNYNCFRYYYALYTYFKIIKWNSNMQLLRLHIHYMLMHIPVVWKKNHVETSVLLPFWTNILNPPPLVLLLFFFFFCFKKLLRLKINILALIHLKINFPAELLQKINNPSRQNLQGRPPLQNNLVVPLCKTAILSSSVKCQTFPLHPFIDEEWIGFPLLRCELSNSTLHLRTIYDLTCALYTLI